MIVRHADIRVEEDLQGAELHSLSAARTAAIERIWDMLAAESGCPRTTGRSIVIENKAGQPLARVTFDEAIRAGKEVH